MAYKGGGAHEDFYVFIFIALKNSLEGQVWCHLVDIVINPSTTARFTSHPETITFNNVIYQPVPFQVGDTEMSGDGSLASLNVDVSNYGGMALKFAKDNDLTLNDVTIRMINTTLPSSGQEDMMQLQILSAVFINEAARFNLGFNFNYDAEGPRLTWNRRDFPTMPLNASKFFIY